MSHYGFSSQDNRKNFPCLDFSFSSLPILAHPHATVDATSGISVSNLSLTEKQGLDTLSVTFPSTYRLSCLELCHASADDIITLPNLSIFIQVFCDTRFLGSVLFQVKSWRASGCRGCPCWGLDQFIRGQQRRGQDKE